MGHERSECAHGTQAQRWPHGIQANCFSSQRQIKQLLFEEFDINSIIFSFFIFWIFDGIINLSLLLIFSR